MSAQVRFQGHVEEVAGPVGELVGVGVVGADLRDLRLHDPQAPEEFAGRVAVGDQEARYRRTAEISPPGRSSRCGGVLIGRP